jgi:hypothetical protein
MTLIHPIVPVAPQPPAVDPVRRVTRAGDDEQRDERPPRREQRHAAKPADDAAQPVVTADGHLDTRA